jgi:hypothetical protein
MPINLCNIIRKLLPKCGTKLSPVSDDELIKSVIFQNNLFWQHDHQHDGPSWKMKSFPGGSLGSPYFFNN